MLSVKSSATLSCHVICPPHDDIATACSCCITRRPRANISTACSHLPTTHAKTTPPPALVALSAVHCLHKIATACSCHILCCQHDNIASACSCCILHAICHCITTTLLPDLAASDGSRGGEGGGSGRGVEGGGSCIERWQRQGRWRPQQVVPFFLSPLTFSLFTFHFLEHLKRWAKKRRLKKNGRLF